MKKRSISWKINCRIGSVIFPKIFQSFYGSNFQCMNFKTYCKQWSRENWVWFINKSSTWLKATALPLKYKESNKKCAEQISDSCSMLSSYITMHILWHCSCGRCVFQSLRSYISMNGTEWNTEKHSLFSAMNMKLSYFVFDSGKEKISNLK